MLISRVIVAVVLLFGAGKAGDPALVGTWALAGNDFVVFKADGRGVLDGENFSWKADGKTVTVDFGTEDEVEQMTYVVKGDQLTMSMGGIPLAFQRTGKAPKATKAAPEPGPVKAPAGKAAVASANNTGDLAKLLLSSAWCSMWFNKTTGYSGTERVQFFQDGTFQQGAQAEGYSSGYGGTMASQHNTGKSGRWQTKGSKFFLANDETGGQMVEYPYSLTRNSSGSPIITSSGKEYMMCK